MTIETQQGKKSWIGDGSTTNYPYSYPFLNASDIEVYLDGEKQASGFSVQNKTDYSTGANIIFDVAPAEGVLIVIRRNVPMTQEISYPENGEFPAKSHEKSLDKLTMLIIDNNKETLKVGPATPEDFDATFPVPEANKALKITADGKGFTMSDYDPDTALALTEDFKNQAQQAAIDALSSQTAAANSETVATQQANIATEKTAEVVESSTIAVQNIDTAFNAASEWFSKLNAIPYIPVGTILPTTGAIDESLGYQRYANGQLIANVSSQAPDLVKFLEFQEAHAPNLLCSETEWQAALTLSTLGQVGKYVWNKEEDSVRIPRIVNIQGMIDMNTVGNMIEAGLPNIEGSLSGGWLSATATGAFRYTQSNRNINGNAGGSTVGNFELNLDASLSNSTYGNSDTVQEESILYPYVLQIATGVQYKTPVQNELMSNNPFFFGYYQFFEVAPNNISWLKSAAQWNSAKTHGDYYNWLAEERVNPKDIPVRANVTKVGNIIDNDGVLSGFSSSNYALSTKIPTNVTSYEICTRFTITSAATASQQGIFANSENNRCTPQITYNLADDVSTVCALHPIDSSTWTDNLAFPAEVNKTYRVKIIWDGSLFSMYYKEDESDTWTLVGQEEATTIYWTQVMGIGIDGTANYYPFSGSIDLNESYINIDGQRWWSGMKSKVRLHTEDYDDYDWVINPGDQTFRLPLKVLGASGSAIVGNGMTLGFTNGTSNGGLYGYTEVTSKVMTVEPNSYGNPVGSGNPGVGLVYSLGVTDDPTKSGIETSTKGLSLYFYVGGIAKNEHIVDVGRIEETLVDKANKIDVDGQWVAKRIFIEPSKTVGSHSYDLSEYLPNDGNNYLIMINLFLTASSNCVTTFGNKPSPNENECMSFSVYGNNTGARDGNCGYIVIGNDRTLYSQILGSAPNTLSTYIVAYRRIGTNV